MKITRRNFFLNTGIAALTAAVAFPAQNVFGQMLKTGEIFPVPPESSNDALSYLRRENFETFINTFFQFQPDEGRPFRLQLIEVENLVKDGNQKQGLTGESYSLLFEGTPKRKMPQGTYRTIHELGEFSLLIVPVESTGNRYEAVINRINQ